MADLYLNLKGEYYDQIKSGEKVFEYRLNNEYWQKRLIGREYDSIIIRRGYPSKDDETRILTLPYRGYKRMIIKHEHFGPNPVAVFAIYTTKETPTTNEQE